jgi:DNA topoisomerase-3
MDSNELVEVAYERMLNMNKVLVLAEKPSVGRDIARVLKCSKKGSGYLEGDQYVVTWALGHLVTLADPEEYNPKYRIWKTEDLPMLPAHLQLVVIKQSRKQFYNVKEQMKRKDVSRIIIATDAGREGELVARWIIKKSQVKKPIQRLWISSITDKAIKDGFAHLKDGKLYENLYVSAVARAEADWIVGINATRALTCKYNAQLSCGRVQTPTLAMIAKREEEIKNFREKEFYGITALTKELKLIWQNIDTKDMKTFDRDKCGRIISSIQRKDAKVIDVKTSYKKSYAPRLYDLTELQRDANKIFDYSAKETLSILQRLYENHKLLTYPRTDSRYITTDIVDTLRERMKACGIGIYQPMVDKILKKPIRVNKSFVDNSKVSDHHALIPTEQRVSLSKLSEKERRIYDLVIRRFLSVLYPPLEYEQTTIIAKIGEEYFIAKGKRIISQGWKVIYANHVDVEDTCENIPEQVLPKVNKGDILKVTSVMETKGYTKPPHYLMKEVYYLPWKIQ